MQHAQCIVHRYSGAWHVELSIFSKIDDGRKEVCNLCLLLDEEMYDHIYSSECSETEPFPCSILYKLYCISLKEVILHGIAQGSILSEFQVGFQSSSQLPVWKQGLNLDLNHPESQSHKLIRMDLQYQQKLQKKQMQCFYLPLQVAVFMSSSE